jgi:hypothetical protein
MSEHLVKHTRKAFSIFRVKNNMNWKHKVSELLFEVLIIVFAVSVSLLLERWREKAIEHEQEKEFLVGLREDLSHDIDEIRGDSSAYSFGLKAYNFFIRSAGTYVPDSAQYYFYVYSFSTLQPNVSRFEGLKSSGKLDIIENHELRQEIIRLYEEKFPIVIMNTTFHLNTTQQPLMDYVDHQVDFKSSKDRNESLSKVLSQTYPQNIFAIRKLYIREIIRRYHEASVTARKIIKLIDDEKLTHD